jgi:putative hydrolase of the HAD superfamily
MAQYMDERLGLPKEQIPELRRHYFQTYGTTLRGLQRHHHVDADDYLAYVHDLPLSEYIQPDPELRNLLLSLPQPRWIFTNADAAHAGRVLSVLGMSDCFTGIIDIRAVEFACKPEPEAYLRALVCSGNPDSQNCVLFDDSILNLGGAHRLGFTTAWVNPRGETHPDADFVLPNLLSLPQVMPELWRNHHGVANP